MFFSNSLIFFIATREAGEHGSSIVIARTTMRLLFTLLLTACLLQASHASPPPVTANSANAPLPWLQVGRSTLRQAEQLWQAQQATLLSQRYGNALESFSNGLPREVSNLRVVVSEVQQWGRFAQVKLGFFDGVLYRLNATLAAGYRYDEAVQQLSRQYGTPLSQSNEPRQSYWQAGDVWVALQAGDDSKAVLQVEHRQLARKVRTSNMEAYAGYVVAKPAGRSILSP